MNTQLIPVFNGTISNETTLLCDARELHDFLEVGCDFSSWVKRRITEYKFAANVDYIEFSSSLRKTTGRDKKDYHLTLDTAKELAMVERNDKGRQVRRYFIECEKRLQQQLPTAIDEKLPLGVYAHQSKYNPYRASVFLDGKNIHVGVFPTIQDAVLARHEYLRRHHVNRVIEGNLDIASPAGINARLLITVEHGQATRSKIMHPDAITATPDNLPDVLKSYGLGKISTQQYQKIIEACVSVIARKCENLQLTAK